MSTVETPQPSTRADTTEMILPEVPESDAAGESNMLGCEPIDIELQPAKQRIMLLLDKSSSMVDRTRLWDHDQDPNTEPVTRWSSLHRGVEALTQRFGGAIQFGVQLFPSVGAHLSLAQACAVQPNPEFGLDSNASLLSALPSRDSQDGELGGATPTRAGFETALTHLLRLEQEDKLTVRLVDPPSILLITDGAATCGQRDDLHCLQHLESLTPPPECGTRWFGTYDSGIHHAVRNARSQHGVQTFVVGLGIAPGPDLNATQVDLQPKLSELAIDGGTALTGGLHQFYNASSQDALEQALFAIAQSSLSCTIDLDDTVQAEGISYAELRVKETALSFLPETRSCGEKDGWFWGEPQNGRARVELCGSACRAVHKAGDLRLKVYWQTCSE